MKKMLIIEDDQIVGNIYRHKFQVAGYQVELATDGEAGLAAVSKFQPDVVILDLMLPKLNGVEVLQRLRAQPETQALPVIVLSNAYLSHLVQDAWKAGANQCMVKASSTPQKVMEVVNKLLGVATESRPESELPTPNKEARSAGERTGRPNSERPAAGPQPVGATDDDTAFQAELRESFLVSAPDQIAQTRAMLQTFIKSEGDAARLPQLFALYRKVHSLTSNAAVSGAASVAQLASALEAFLKELYEKPKSITASTIRTLAHTIDFLPVLVENSAAPGRSDEPAPNILVVDDEAISRRAVVYALEKAHLRCVSVDDPATALKMLAENRFDLIFLDVEMPGMNGFDLCAKLRTLPGHAKTPVVFVTGLTDFESRTRSTLSGGTDLIAKPFLFMELAIKALTYIYRAQIGGAKS